MLKIIATYKCILTISSLYTVESLCYVMSFNVDRSLKLICVFADNHLVIYDSWFNNKLHFQN